jgi:hypothetical protein
LTTDADLLNDPKPKTMAECKQHLDWIKWKEVIEVDLGSPKRREVFSAVIPTPSRVDPIRFKWVFIRKQNETNTVVR